MGDPQIEDLIKMQKVLMEHIPHKHIIKTEHQGLVTASLGVIEEVMEFLNAIGFKSWRPNPLPREAQLEELTDVLFFYLEMVILGNFSWEEVVQQYNRKWIENMERYRKAREGNYDWDLRGKKEGL